jgi:hypothetical protein
MRHPDGRSVSGCQEKWPDRRIGRRSGRPERRKHCAARCGFPGTPPSAIVHAVPEFICGMSDNIYPDCRSYPES